MTGAPLFFDQAHYQFRSELKGTTLSELIPLPERYSEHTTDDGTNPLFILHLAGFHSLRIIHSCVYNKLSCILPGSIDLDQYIQPLLTSTLKTDASVYIRPESEHKFLQLLKRFHQDFHWDFLSDAEAGQDPDAYSGLMCYSLHPGAVGVAQGSAILTREIRDYTDENLSRFRDEL